MVAIIPARGGSKGLPGKNIKSFNGLPLLAHTIRAANGAKCLHRVMVTTDSQEIADVALTYGAEVPFLRPGYLAEDTSSAIDVYLHATEYMKEQGENIDKFMVLLPTAPLRNKEDIEAAYERFCSCNATTLISMKESEIPPSWYFTCNEKGILSNANLTGENSLLNRQNYQAYYVPNGAIYILDYQLLKNKRTYYSENTFAYVMSAGRSVDIDGELDFEIAEYLARKYGR